MKISLNWVLDHIKDSDKSSSDKSRNKDLYKNIDIEKLIEKFNKTTAEIDSYKKVNLDLNNLFLAKAKSLVDDKILVENQETNKIIELEMRDNINLNGLYLVRGSQDKNKYFWATLEGLGSEKDGLVPELYCSKEVVDGSWKEKVEKEDYILEVDNTSITNRPDLWGHRGFAREVAALLDKELIEEKDLLSDCEYKEVKHFTIEAPVEKTEVFNIEINDINSCDRFAGLYIDQIDNNPSNIFTAFRLAKVDARPINAIVDLTNYVMLDISQPMHAFDADKIKDNIIKVRLAKSGETIKLLDKTSINLTDKDLVVADIKGPIALAGIIGGLDSSVSSDTKRIFLESAHFNPGVIRESSTRFKIRTDASSRFEKNIDPNQNVTGILRLLKLLNEFNINYKLKGPIASLGSKVKEKMIKITHEFINNKIGLDIDPKEIVKILTSLGFGVEQNYKEDAQIEFMVNVPTYRGTKDIQIKEDIVEEIARFIGLDNIPYVLPERSMEPFSVKEVMRTRSIKEHMAYGLSMNELHSYAFFDQDFIKKINWDPVDTVNIVNPISENWSRLVTTLIPSLLKAVISNKNKRKNLRFFEISRIWELIGTKAKESKNLAGIIYNDKEEVDFYDAKMHLNTLFDLLSIDVEWRKINIDLGRSLDPWYHPYQTAELVYDDKVIGIAGKSNVEFFSKNNLNSAFMFEIDANFLLTIEKEDKLFDPLPKYQDVSLDISMLVPLDITVEQLENAIYSAQENIIEVELIDFFEKPEWKNEKSITMRFVIYDPNKTLIKEDIDYIWDQVVNKVSDIGAKVR